MRLPPRHLRPQAPAPADHQDPHEGHTDGQNVSTGHQHDNTPPVEFLTQFAAQQNTIPSIVKTALHPAAHGTGPLQFQPQEPQDSHPSTTEHTSIAAGTDNGPDQSSPPSSLSPGSQLPSFEPLHPDSVFNAAFIAAREGRGGFIVEVAPKASDDGNEGAGEGEDDENGKGPNQAGPMVRRSKSSSISLPPPDRELSTGVVIATSRTPSNL